MSYRAKNFAFGKLAAALAADQMTFAVGSMEGDRFPVIANGDYTRLVLDDGSGTYEVVQVSARATGADTMTLSARGVEGTVARTWPAGTYVECRPTAAMMESAAAHADKTVAAHAASAISVVPTGGIATLNVQAALEELDAEKVGSGGAGASGTWNIDINGKAASATNATNAQTAVNAQTATKLARGGAAGQIMTSGGAGVDPSWQAPPAVPVTSVFGRAGAVSLTLQDITGAGGAAAHGHPYAPTSAIVGAAWVNPGGSAAYYEYLRFTRADGSTFDVNTVYHGASSGSGGGE